MSALLESLIAGGISVPTYVDDVFSAYTYKPPGGPITITNGIDLAGKGGLLWIKDRVLENHYLVDTDRGIGKYLSTNTTTGSTTDGAGNNVIAFNSNGFNLEITTGGGLAAGTNHNYISWTFRKAPKFFDVVTYTGNAGTKVVPHSLVSTPGMIVVKRTDTTGDWVVYHQSVPANCGFLNTTNSFASAQRFSSVTSSDFTINVSTADVNANGGTYVAYLFAHDTSTDGLIQCGSFTTDGSGNATVNLGWEPQFCIGKASSTTSTWVTVDSMRGMTTAGGTNAQLFPNTSAAEASGGGYFHPTADGFTFSGGGASATWIYLAIRRPNKPPTTGTQVYNAIARTGTGAAATDSIGFEGDLAVVRNRTGTNQTLFIDRLRGDLAWLASTLTAAESSAAYYGGSDGDLPSFTRAGVANTVRVAGNIATWNSSGQTYINHFFKRAVGVHDQVCDTSTGAAHTVAHGLGVAPELWIRKVRDDVNVWTIGCSLLGADKYLQFDTAAVVTDTTAWNNTLPTISVFTLGTLNQVNRATPKQYVSYLFATKAGISKVGSYTGTATTNAIDCGFTTGARFVLIKRTDSTGDWYVWDTVRGIIAGNDPYLLLNSTAAEVTSTDYIDPVSTGFELSSTAPAAINASGGTFIYLAYS